LVKFRKKERGKGEREGKQEERGEKKKERKRGRIFLSFVDRKEGKKRIHAGFLRNARPRGKEGRKGGGERGKKKKKKKKKKWKSTGRKPRNHTYSQLPFSWREGEEKTIEEKKGRRGGGKKGGRVTLRKNAAFSTYGDFSLGKNKRRGGDHWKEREKEKGGNSKWIGPPLTRIFTKIPSGSPRKEGKKKKKKGRKKKKKRGKRGGKRGKGGDTSFAPSAFSGKF